jgi:tetratricopeptide (TPR) repeat protein
MIGHGLGPALAFAGLLGAAAPAAHADDQHAGHHGAGAAPQALGDVHFAIGCTPEAQARFDGAMRLQHSFWYQQAAAAFRTVREADPGCAMSYWGEAMALLLNPFNAPVAQNLREGQALLAEARRIGGRDEREAGYIAALSEAFAGTDLPGHRARLERYEAAMAALHARFPEDSEAAILYALALDIAASPNDKTYARQLRAAEILEREFARQPQHPGVAHYLIHTYDVPPLAARGLPAAQRYAGIAPDAPHALHMPSHIFTRVGQWTASVDTNRRSAEVARASGEIDDELHATDYMVYAYLQGGQDGAARAIVEGLGGGARATPKRNAGFFALAAMPARYALERGDWTGAASLVPRESEFRYVTAMTHFARALGAARGGQPGRTGDDLAALDRIAEELRGRDPYWTEQVSIQRLSAEGWTAFAAGDRARGLDLLKQASAREALTEKAPVTPGPLAPARELLAEALLESGDAAGALVEFQRVQENEPNRFRAVLGAARAAEQAGQAEVARQHYARLLEIAAADTPRPEIAVARRYLGRG